ncbi:MAG: type II toxin-antitoxin system RelE/ParE family toxin [Gemmataceae bacterium]
MARTVTVQQRAVADQLAIVRSISRLVSVASATRWRQRIEKVIAALANDADQWPEADEASGLGIDLRYRLFDRHRHAYRVLFTIDDQTVYVHRVLHAAQDWITADDL